MFKKLATVALLAAAGSAFAVDGTVTVTGVVSSATCTISAPNTVVLPTVSRSSLGAAGQVAGITPWAVSVSSCSAASMNTFFEYGSTINPSGRLINAGTALFVEGQVLNSSLGVVNLAGAAGSQNTTAVTVTGNAASQQFYIRYYATGVATAGTFSTSFTYTLIYT